MARLICTPAVLRSLALVSALLLCGCVSAEQSNSVNDAIGAAWKPEIDALLHAEGSHAFSVSHQQAFATLVRTLQSLGFSIDERDEQSGVIRASAVGPTPLTWAEWGTASSIEIPRLTKIVSEGMGSLAGAYVSASSSKFTSLQPEYNRLVFTASVVGGQNGGTISMSVKMAQLVFGVPGTTHQPSYPPPEVARIAVKRIWAAFDNQIRNGALANSAIPDNEPARPRAPTVSVPSQPSTAFTKPNPSARFIQMEQEGGTYVVPVLINNALTLNFVVDSGAADVSIPADVVLTLFRTGTLSGQDFLGTQTYVLADGSRVPSKNFRIKSLKVGNTLVRNVTGSVADVKGELLLGQSFLGRFKSWSIDNARHALLLIE